ncbi:alcohol dehydrogenase transcription factor myb/SANT-like domain-containing protein [Phthorimaea operculella]|nr:alcohol dehydrogenase transcription factor myb/SANT-like domain-containing protein [Phthorimaea operculella]
MGDLEWTNDLVIRLMQEYQKRPELWDASHEMYRVQTLKYETWRELAGLFECDIADLRKKLNSLFASHRREKAKIRAGGKTSWFLYPYMSFLPTHIEADSTPSEALQHTNTSTKKRPPPVKEVAPASDDDDPDYAAETEFLEEDEQQPDEVLLIKQEPSQPMMVTVQPIHHGSARLKRGRERAKPRLTRPVRRRVLKDPHISSASSTLDGRLAEALKLLRRSDLTRRKDECDSFGEYIADSLRKHDDRTHEVNSKQNLLVNWLHAPAQHGSKPVGTGSNGASTQQPSLCSPSSTQNTLNTSLFLRNWGQQKLVDLCTNTQHTNNSHQIKTP